MCTRAFPTKYGRREGMNCVAIIHDVSPFGHILLEDPNNNVRYVRDPEYNDRKWCRVPDEWFVKKVSWKKGEYVSKKSSEESMMTWKKAFSLFDSYGNFNNESDFALRVFRNFEEREIKLIPSSAFWNDSDQCLTIDWQSFFVIVGKDGKNEFSDKSGLDMKKFLFIDNLIEYVKEYIKQ